MKPEIKVRKAKSDDAASIMDLHVSSIRRLADESYAEAVVASWSGNKEPSQYVEAMNSGERMVVAEEERIIVGFGSVIPAEKEVRAVYVHPDHTRKGIGTALLEELEKIAISEGVREVKLAASLNAVEFYRASGFNPGDRFEHSLHDGTKIECVWMSKVLTMM